ncbi:MAG: AAA family ATPase [Candidatus Woesearchaeota archaeon]
MKIGVSGSHGTGKSFTVYELANRYKLEYPTKEVTVITEVARDCPLPINQGTTIKAQEWMISNQIQREINAENNCDIIITDRTLADYLAYTRSKYEHLYHKLLPFLKYYISSYDVIFYKTLENNNQYLINDGVRDVDEEFQKNIDTSLQDIYNLLKTNLKDFRYI